MNSTTIIIQVCTYKLVLEAKYSSFEHEFLHYNLILILIQCFDPIALHTYCTNVSCVIYILVGTTLQFTLILCFDPMVSIECIGIGLLLYLCKRCDPVQSCNPVALDQTVDQCTSAIKNSGLGTFCTLQKLI